MSVQRSKYALLKNGSEEDDIYQADFKHERKSFAAERTPFMSVSDKEATQRKKLGLKRSIGIFSGATIVVGSMIGSGIFIVPTGVLRSCHGNIPFSLVAWIAGGIIAILMALCYCELATTIPESGGTAVYLKKIYGNLVCFIYLWLVLLAMQPQGTAVQIIALGEYVLWAVQSVTQHCFEGDTQFLSKLIGLTFVFPILMCNMISVKWAMKLQVICTVGKVAALIMLCFAGFMMFILDSSTLKKNFKLLDAHSSAQANTTFSSLHKSSSDMGSEMLSDISLAIFQALWAYDGFDNITLVTEEVKKPKKTLPAIIIVSTLFVMILYICVNMSFFAVLTSEEMLMSNAVAVSFARKIHPILTYLVTAGVCLSLIGSINVSFVASGRVPFVAGRMGFMPEVLSMVHVNFYSPLPALLFVTFLGAIMLLPSSIDALLQSVVFAAWAFRALCAVGILLLRRLPLGEETPYKVYKITAILAALLGAYMTCVPLVFDPKLLYGFTIVLFIIFFFVYKLLQRGYISMQGGGIITLYMQKCLLVAVPDSVKSN